MAKQVITLLLSLNKRYSWKRIICSKRIYAQEQIYAQKQVWVQKMDRPQNLTPQALSRWIPQLIKENKLYRFYKTPEFKWLRENILQENHYECEDCKAKSPSVITRATTVHHDLTVKEHPELALATFWIDEHGQKHKQLWALCEDCHNARHERFGHGEAKKVEPLTPERW